MKKIGKLAVTSVLVLSMAMGVGCSSKGMDQGADAPQDTPKDVAKVEDKVYIVGTNPMFEPFEFVGDDDKIVGFDIDLIKAVAEDQGLKVEVQDMGFDALVGSVQTGAIDIIASGMSIKEDRKKQVAFTTDYITAGLSIAVANGNTDINGLDDLQGKVVAAQIGTTGADKCYELEKDGIAKEVRILENANLCMLDLQNGGVDAVINDIPVTDAFMAKQPGKIKVVGEPLGEEVYAFAVNLEAKELLEKLNAGLANVKANGTYDEIHAKYFGGAE